MPATSYVETNSRDAEYVETNLRDADVIRCYPCRPLPPDDTAAIIAGASVAGLILLVP